MRTFVLLFAVWAAPAGASSVSASSAAEAWLRNHAGAPDELAELKSVNPDAFAIVQALLTKRSLGLLNPKHPTTRMTDDRPPPAAAAEAAPLAAVATHAEVQVEEPVATPKVELPYASVKSAHHDWLNWKPHSSAADETMVANVMGMVAGARAAPAASAAVEATAEVADAPPAAEVAAEPAPKATSGWGSIGNMWGMHKKAPQPAVAPRVAAPMEAVPEVAEPQPSTAVVADSMPKATSDWGSLGSMLGLRKKVRPAPQAVSEDAVAFHPDEVSRPVAQRQTTDWTTVEKMKQNKDDKAVTNLLKMVAQLKGGKSAEKLLSKHHIEDSESDSGGLLSKDLADWGDAPEQAPQIVPVATQPVTEAVPLPPAVIAPSAPMPVVESIPAKQSGWGDIGGMLGVHKKPHHDLPVVPSADAGSSSPFGLNWKPKPAGADEAMVANVLGMVGAKAAAKDVVDAPAAVPQEALAPVEPQPMREEQRTAEPPKQDRDEKAVNSLLNMVAQLKGGKAAEKLLKKHHVEAEDNSLASDAAAFSAPETTPVAEAPKPQESSWGSIGQMWGQPQAAPKPQPAVQPSEDTQRQAAAEELAASAMPAQHLRKKDDYTSDMNKKQNADDTAVNSLLSMVAQLKGSKKAAQLADKYDHGQSEQTQRTQQVQQSPLANDMNMFSAADIEEAPETPARPARRSGNNFLDSLTSSLGRAPAPEKPHRRVAALAKENSYLKEFNMLTDAEQEQKATAQEETPRVRKSSKLMAWLDPEPEEPAQKAPVKPEAPVNRYLADLS